MRGDGAAQESLSACGRTAVDPEDDLEVPGHGLRDALACLDDERVQVPAVRVERECLGGDGEADGGVRVADVGDVVHAVEVPGAVLRGEGGGWWVWV